MQQQKIVSINGRQYDAITGMLIDQHAVTEAVSTTTPAPKRTVEKQAIHAPVLQRSQTLRRRAAAKPQVVATAAPAPAPQAPTVTTPAVTPLIRRTQPLHRAVSRAQATSQLTSSSAPLQRPEQLRRKQPAHIQPAANRPAAATAPRPVAGPPRSMSDIAPQQHPAAKKAYTMQQQKVAHDTAPKAPKSATHIKEEAIESALSSAIRNEKPHKQPKKNRWSRFASVGASALALLLLGGYFTYINMPNLSVRVAAAQAGFDASYPEYRPDGYRLNGPIAAENGKVTMKFASNAGPQNFALKQEKSTWDSFAVREYVSEISNDNAITTTVDGLTIYIYGSNAAWVNGGVLYTMNGDAPLSGEQIRRIATSM